MPIAIEPGESYPHTRLFNLCKIQILCSTKCVSSGPSYPIHLRCRFWSWARWVQSTPSYLVSQNN